MTTLDQARERLEAGDVPGAMNALRGAVDDVPLAELAAYVADSARAMGFDELVSAGAALAADPDDPEACYDFGYECVEHGAAFAGLPALRAGLAAVPTALPLRFELVSALEDEERHGEAVTVLRAHPGDLPDWPGRYLLAFNSLASGDAAGARAEVDRLPAPDDASWEVAHERIRRMVDRAETAASAGPLDESDLRGWHFALNGAVLTRLSPFGFDDGMRGRYAFLQDSFDLCRVGLDRLALVLRSAGRTPSGVCALPGRSSRVLGLATAEFLGLPLLPFDPDRPGTLVVAHDLSAVDLDAYSALADRAPGQILFEHASCWTDPPGVAADVVTVVHQVIGQPWGERLRMGEDREVERIPEDTRPEEELAAEILAADGGPEKPEDGAVPDDSDAVLSAFVDAVSPRWATGRRLQVRTCGPVRSNKLTKLT